MVDDLEQEDLAQFAALAHDRQLQLANFSTQQTLAEQGLAADTMEEHLSTVQLALMRLADNVITELAKLETIMSDRLAALVQRLDELERRPGEVEGRLGSKEYEP